MADAQIAKVVLALNSLDKARGMISEAINDGGNYTMKLQAIADMLRYCEEELRNIQYGK